MFIGEMFIGEMFIGEMFIGEMFIGEERLVLYQSRLHGFCSRLNKSDTASRSTPQTDRRRNTDAYR
jgi:hypothetical protein